MQVDDTQNSIDDLTLALDGYGSEQSNEALVEREEESGGMNVDWDLPGMESNIYHFLKYSILAQRHARERGVRQSMDQRRDRLIWRKSVSLTTRSLR
jgi:hypothetical protein